ncbi:MAG: isoprenoid biosynthesis glyoxalase ElbB [Deltaproteobacteria bacterium]|nr:isoprenoid biosynthesis glyoxalase ElbB [Deltaproteobacteria bacterium]
MKKIGVLLSGCGVNDGSEIHEAVITLLALDRLGAQAVMMAPDVDFEEVNHCTNQPTGQKRNALVESARIARGNIKDIRGISAQEIDALVLPGGFGAAKNLSNFASAGENAKAHPEVARLVKEMLQNKKPIGALCIAPATIAVILGADLHPTLTIGHDAGVAAKMEAMGARHQECDVGDIVFDEQNKILSTPAYMCAKSIKEAATGIEKLIKKLVEIA